MKEILIKQSEEAIHTSSLSNETGSREKGHQLLVDKVKEYIDSWHEGDDDKTSAASPPLQPWVEQARFRRNLFENQ